MEIAQQKKQQTNKKILRVSVHLYMGSCFALPVAPRRKRIRIHTKQRNKRDC